MNINNNSLLEQGCVLAQNLMNLWDTFQKQIQQQQSAQIVILLGSSRSGKSTLFHLLKGSNFNLSKNQKQFQLGLAEATHTSSNQNSNCDQANQFELHFTFIQAENHLLINTSNFINLKNQMNSIIWEEFFLRLIKNYSIKILYILKHPETELQSRGSELQSFIKKYFGQKIEIFLNTTIILNFYQDYFSDEELIENVQGELKQTFKNFNQNILVIRRVKTQEDFEKYFSQKNRKYIWNSIKTTNRIKMDPNQFNIDINSLNILESLFTQPFRATLNYINQEYNNREQSLKLKELQTIQEQLKLLLDSVKNQGKNIEFWFDDFLTSSSKVLKLISPSYDEFIQFDFNQLQMVANNFEFSIKFSQVLENIINLTLNSCQEILQNVQVKLNLLKQIKSTQYQFSPQKELNQFDPQNGKVLNEDQVQNPQIEQSQKEFKMQKEPKQKGVKQLIQEYNQQKLQYVQILNTKKDPQLLSDFIKITFTIDQILGLMQEKLNKTNNCNTF